MVRIHYAKNPLSINSGPHLCTGENTSARRRIGLSRTPHLPESYFMHFGWHYLSNATYRLGPDLLSTALLVKYGYLILLQYSPLLKKACVRQVVLDEWFPLIIVVLCFSPVHTGSAPGAHGASHRRTTNCMKRRRVTASLMSAAYP